MASCSNLVELLQARASTQPHDRAYTFLADGETEGRVLTYGELESLTRAVAVRLSEHVRTGDRVILLYPPGLDFIVAFLACQLAGAVAVPVYPPRKPEEWPRFAAIATDCSAAAICTLAEHAPILKMGLDSTPALAHVALIASDTVDAAAGGAWRMPDITPESLAFLQYTSGSTGVPKGVMVSHANLLHNESIIKQGFGNDRDLVVVSWLPQYHDMGLIGGILQPLYLGGHGVLMSPFAFLQQPMRWLQAMSRYRATVAGAPNFAYALCAARATDEIVAKLDLSAWRLAFNGAEPVRLSTLEKFAERFAPAGFRREGFFPCYGLAEGTLYVTGAPRGRFPRALHVDAGELERHKLVPTENDAPGSRALVGCGGPIETIVRIVDPHTLAACEPGAIGEIWVQGPSVARGYWNRPDATRDTFDARIAGSGEGPFLRTGDLGVLHDEELFVTGRLKELIIVDGRNHYPQDIEETVQSGRPALRSGCGAAFSLEVDGAERLVVIQEVVKGGAGIDLARVASDIRAAVAARHGIAIHALVFIQERGVQKTSSGKIRRGVMRDRFRDGKLAVVLASVGAPVPAAAAIPAKTPLPSAIATEASRRSSLTRTEQLVASLIAQKLGVGVAEIDVEASFSSFGLDSRALVGLSGELETALERRLEPQIFYNYASIAALARFLAGDEARRPRTSVVPATTRGALAIVGMACRFPGAPDLDAFWELLRTGKDAITEVPSSRWDLAHWFDADPSAPGKMATRWGGFIDDVDAFDADFFGTSPREAEAMDPQQRLMLQLAWHALENGGIRPETLRGSRTGVFVGISGSDYARLQAGTTGLFSAHAGTGNALSIVANRLSYFMDLHGPSLAIDTACSSSLSALHTAAVHLHSGECDAALVGGINLLLSPDVTVSFSQNRMMAPDGRCKAFSKDADGYVRAEGGGMIVLKRLEDALAAGDRIWAVVPASACNQDGRSNGLTAPSGLAQQAVVRDALEQAGWQPSDVQFVETHGTGTRLGDPIEAEALGAVYGAGRDPSAPLVLGAVKSQIGHLEAAAGMAGVIKTALCLAHRTVVANLHCDETNPLIRTDEWRLALPRANDAWPAASRRRAGVSAFGFGGTNAHVLLEEAPVAAPQSVPARPARRLQVLALSARSDAALAALSDAHVAALSAGDVDAATHCHTANTRRAHFREARRAVFGTTAAELAAALVERKSAERFVPPKRGVAFLFTGQGAQYVDMGRALYEGHPEFRAILDECDLALRGTRSLGLLELLYPPPEKAAEMDALLASTEYTQPALFALEYALAKLWLAWGVRPAVVMGHSLGEIVAAAIAGVFSLQDGLKLVEARGRLMKALPEAGGMLAVFAHERDLDALLPRFTGRLSIGAFNGPGQMVLSGAMRELEKARQILQQRGIEAKPLKVSHAFHSPLMEPILDELRRVAESIAYSEPSIPVVSNVTGQCETERVASAAYWVEHVMAPVRFAHGVEALKKLDVGILLEIGPRPVLIGMARRMLPASGYLFQPSLDAGKDDWQRLAGSLQALHEAGIAIDWTAFDAPFAVSTAPRASAPLYPFATKRFWFEASSAGPTGGRAQPGVHPLLGRALSSPRLAKGERRFESKIHLPGPAFLRAPVESVERRVSLLAYLEMALEAQRQILADSTRCARDLRLEGLLQVTRDEPRTVQTICEPLGNDDYRMEVWAADDDGEWRKVAQSKLGPGPAATIAEPLPALRARIQEPLDVDAWYETTRESGLQYCMSPFPAIRQMWWAPSEVLAEVTAREEDDVVSGEIWLKHCMWNACNQVLGALCPRDGHGTYFPVSLRAARFFGQPGRSLVLHGTLREHDTDGPSCLVDVTAYDDTGLPVAMIEGVRLVPDETVRTPRAEWRNAEPEARPALVIKALRRVVARAFKRAPEEIPIRQPLTALGLDSLTAMDIVTRVEQMFEVGIDLSSLQEGASLDELAVILDGRLSEAEGWTSRSSAASSPLVELNRGDASLSPLFLLHPTGGSVFCYQELARHLGAQPLVAVQSPAFFGGAQSFGSLEAMAAHHLGAIKARQPSGPYRLGGWSMGGVLAFEIARQLEAAGDEVECLLLIDAMAPGELPAQPSRAYALMLLTRSLGIDLGTLTEDDLHGDLDATLDLILGLGRSQVHALRSLTYGEFRRLLAEFERNLALLAAYQGQPYKGTATVLRAETPLAADRHEASGRDWEMWVTGFDALHTVPGDHFGLLSGSHLVLTASYVRKALKALGGAGAESKDGDAQLALAHARAAENVVIAPPARAKDGFIRSELVIDERHPYFFDHPLDHVSGILMLEGLLQLLEASSLTKNRFIRHMRLTFPRFCEKDRPVALELAPMRDAETRTCRAVQGGLPVCTLKFHTDAIPAAAPRIATSTRVTPADAKLLHKSRAANVLIGQWAVSDGAAEAILLEPPAGHLLSEGDDAYHSPLYLLETARQLVTGLAHSAYGVPLGMPMNLVGVELGLDAPIPRGVPVSLRHALRSLPAPGASTFAHFDIDVVAGHDVLGNCRLTAQLLTKEAYLRVRNRHHRAVAA
jgi:acyl transferase domain-containing protein/acyl-CoA synthetase (AMP-forming)/AMP-acid ligase II/thioesterase domain-containing protein